MPDSVGIDLGREALAIAVVTRSRDGVSVKSFEKLAYGDSGAGPAARAAFAARTVSASGLSRLPISVSLSGADVFLRPITVPFTKRSHIAKTLKFEMDGYLPFDIETAVMDFAVSPGAGAGGGTKLLVAAVPREMLEGVTAPFEAAGLKLRAVTADVLSASALSAFVGKERFALMDIGLAGWKLSICGGRRLLFARAAPAAPARETMEAAIAGWFKQSLMAAPTEVAPEAVYLTGEMSDKVDAAELARAVGAPVERFKVSDVRLSGDLAARGLEIASSGLGALAAAAALGREEFNLYAAARGGMSITDRIFAPAATGLVLVTVLAAALGWSYGRQALSFHRQADAAAAQEEALWKDLFGEEAPPGGSVHIGLQAKVKEFSQGASQKALGAKAGPLLKALYTLVRCTPKDSGMEFESFAAASGKAEVKAWAKETATAQKIAEKITAEKLFSAELSDVRRDGESMTFKIVMTPAGGGNVQ